MKDKIMFQVGDNYPVFLDDIDELHLYVFTSFPEVIYVYVSDESLTEYVRETIDNIYEYMRNLVKYMFAYMPQQYIDQLMQESIREYSGGKEGSFTHETQKYYASLKPIDDWVNSQEVIPDWAQKVINERFWDLIDTEVK